MARPIAVDMGYGLYKQLQGQQNRNVVLRAKFLTWDEIADLVNAEMEEIQRAFPGGGGVKVWAAPFRKRAGQLNDGQPLFETICSIDNYCADTRTMLGLGIDIRRMARRLP